MGISLANTAHENFELNTNTLRILTEYISVPQHQNLRNLFNTLHSDSKNAHQGARFILFIRYNSMLASGINFPNYANEIPCSENGSEVIRFPVAAAIALPNAGATGGNPGSPTPVGCTVEGTI